jgi:hypothetical protein
LTFENFCLDTIEDGKEILMLLPHVLQTRLIRVALALVDAMLTLEEDLDIRARSFELLQNWH